MGILARTTYGQTVSVKFIRYRFFIMQLAIRKYGRVLTMFQGAPQPITAKAI
jgi:hypothetical protein